MAIRHTISIDTIPTSCEEVLKIMDTSVYAEELAVDCQRLDIYLPGFTTPVYITTDLDKGFIRTISAVDLGLQAADEEPLASLPDGLYTIKYSISPNEQVYVEYYHMRVSSLENDYYRELCKVRLEACEPTSKQHSKLHDLRYIKMFIDAAVSKAEFCHAPVEATQLYAYAESLLRKYKTGICLTCK